MSMHKFLTCTLLASAVLVAPFRNGFAQQAAEKPADPLPLSRVVMFTSGVGYFEHNGQINGDATVDLRFRANDINDLLKSMVLEDRGGGTVSTVSYGSRDPITKTLKTFPVDLTENPTLGQLLSQVRGERIQVDAPNPITGVLVGVETRKREVGNRGDTVEQEFLNLLTSEGLRSISMDTIGRIKLLDEKLDADLRQALAVLATGHDADKKTVTLNLRGNGQRPVRVAYIQETPVWKTSYRLVLADNEQPFLQGWAIVENTTEADWNNVQLTLVSGRPISFRMDLYEPLYAKRPLEELNLYASLRPQTYGQDMQEKENVALRDARVMSEESLARGGGRMGLAKAAAPPAAPAPGMAANSLGRPVTIVGDVPMQIAQQSASGGEVGELFQYAIGTPVTLQRQKSAMLPIVNEKVQGEKVSIYNENVQAKHPLNGLRLTNSTNLHLMQGPLTVYAGGAYAGDAKIDDLAPKSERLLSYAMDLKTEVAPEGKSRPEQLVSAKIAKGVMTVNRKLARSRQYTIKNSDAKTKTVLVEYPLDANWTLVKPEKPTEKTRDRYRFAVKAEPGKPTVLDVDEEQTISQQIALTNADDNTISYYASQRAISPAVKAALTEVIKRKQALAETVRQRQQTEQQIATITQEQERIRQNMVQLDRNTDLYKRYVQKFGTQEDEVEKFRTDVKRLTNEETQKRKSLDEYLLGLDIA